MQIDCAESILYGKPSPVASFDCHHHRHHLHDFHLSLHHLLLPNPLFLSTHLDHLLHPCLVPQHHLLLDLVDLDPHRGRLVLTRSHLALLRKVQLRLSIPLFPLVPSCRQSWLLMMEPGLPHRTAIPRGRTDFHVRRESFCPSAGLSSTNCSIQAKLDKLELWQYWKHV